MEQAQTVPDRAEAKKALETGDQHERIRGHGGIRFLAMGRVKPSNHRPQTAQAEIETEAALARYGGPVFRYPGDSAALGSGEMLTQPGTPTTTGTP